MLEGYAHSMDIVREFPGEAREYWERRASVAGVSLEEYLLQKLVREARLPTAREVFDRVDREATGHLSSEEAVEILRAERESR